jgi:hypothetical protein
MQERKKTMAEYKLTSNGNIQVGEKGFPVITNDDGQEHELDALTLSDKILSLNQESKKRKEKIRELTESIGKFSGIDDPAAALEALETIKTFGEKDLKSKEELDRLRTEIGEAWEKKIKIQKTGFEDSLAGKETSISLLEDDLFEALVASKFHSSPLFAGEDRKTILTSDIAVTYFGKNYKVEKEDNGKRTVVGYINGNPVLSQERPGEIASFEEAMPRIIEASGQNIMKESTGSGSKKGSGTYSSRTVNAGDHKAFGANILDIAAGKTKVQ